jgi:thiol-disulfide isomerase/thioredoxin
MKLERSGSITIGVIVLVVLAVGYIAILPTLQDRTDDSSDLSQLQSTGSDDQLSFTDLDGKPFDLASLNGTPLVVNGWASWCPFCIDELPAFADLKEEYGDRIAIVAINRKESAATARAYIEHVGNPEGIIFLLDKNDAFYKTIQGYAMPETVFYDSEGNIVFHKRGTMQINEMRAHTEATLNLVQ